MPSWPSNAARCEQQKGQLLEQIGQQQTQLAEWKRQRKETPRHLTLKDLPEQERFTQLRTTKKHFVDTIKLIAYRAETALVQVVRAKLARNDAARARVRQVLTRAVDLCPDPARQTLTVHLHRLSNAIHDDALEHLCAELTATDPLFAGTDLRLMFAPVGTTPVPRNQESGASSCSSLEWPPHPQRRRPFSKSDRGREEPVGHLAPAEASLAGAP